MSNEPARAGTIEFRTSHRIHSLLPIGNKQKSELRLSSAVSDLSGTSELSKHPPSSPSLSIATHSNDLGQSKSVALYSPVPDKEQQELDSITGEKTEAPQTVTCTDDVQPLPSTTEYLDGMTHSDSPPGLLPQFSAWSLCCIGRASDYVPAKGRTVDPVPLRSFIIRCIRPSTTGFSQQSQSSSVLGDQSTQQSSIRQ